MTWEEQNHESPQKVAIAQGQVHGSNALPGSRLMGRHSWRVSPVVRRDLKRPDWA